MATKKAEDQDRGPGAEKVELEKRLDKNRKAVDDADFKETGKGDPAEPNNHAE